MEELEVEKSPRLRLIMSAKTETLLIHSGSPQPIIASASASRASQLSRNNPLRLHLAISFTDIYDSPLPRCITVQSVRQSYVQQLCWIMSLLSHNGIHRSRTPYRRVEVF